MTETIQISLFGSRGEGKTTVLAAWQALREGDGMTLTVVDEDTMRYLRPLAAGLLQGRFPPATPPNRPRLLRWQAHLGERCLPLEGSDFAGELIDPLWNTGPEVIRRLVAQWASTANGLLLFIDSTRSDDVQYLDAIDRLLQELRRHRPRHGGQRRAVAILMTQCDRLPGVAPYDLTDPDAAHRLLQGHRIVQLIRQHLDRAAPFLVYRVFLTSAVGWQFCGLPEPQRRLQPCNLFAPLRWVTEQAAELVKQDRNRRRLTLLYGLALGLVLLVTLWYAAHHQRRKTYARYDQMIQEHPRDGEAADRLAFYNEHIASWPADPLFGMREPRRHADQRADADRRIVARQEAETAFTTWQDTDAALQRQSKHPQRHAAALAYLERHGEAAPESCWQVIHDVRESTRAAWEKERSEWELVSAMSTARLAEQQAKVAALRRYASRGDALDAEAALRLANQVDEQRKGLLAADRHAWEAARNFALEHPAHYAGKRQALQAYADRPDAQCRSEALDLVRLLSQQEAADRRAYSTLAAASHKAATSEAIEALESQAQAYLQASEHDRTMRAAVTRFLQELDDFKKPRAVKISVGRISTPEGFSDNSRGNPRLQVTLSIGGNSYCNASPVNTEKSGDRFVGNLNVACGPYQVVWGTPQRLTLSVRVRRTFPGLFTEETATGSVEDSLYVLNAANGTVRVPTSAGPIEVELQCPDARSPVLPAYKSE